MDTLDASCLVTRAATLREMGGLAASLGHAALPDYCLRLGEKGLRCVWWPFAEFMLTDDKAVDAYGNWAADSAFIERWHGRRAPVNENLVTAEAGWTLRVNDGGKTS